MMTKLLLILALVSGLFSGDFTINMKHYDDGFIGNDEPTIVLNFAGDAKPSNIIGENKNNWIAIYKKGFSNEWENVIEWSWVKDLKEVPQTTALQYNYKINEPGTYEFRFFLNNSYETFATKEFEVKNIEASVSVRLFSRDGGEVAFINASAKGDKSWLGIYKEGASNSWNNVLSWQWVGSTKDIDMFDNHDNVFNTKGLKNGTYEARLFYNNSYNLEAKASFTIDRPNVGEEIIFQDDVTFAYKESNGLNITINHIPEGYTSKDWVGVFPQNKPYTLSNLLAWRYAPNKTGLLDLEFYKKNLLPKEGRKLFYNVVYFKNDTYTKVGKTGDLGISIAGFFMTVSKFDGKLEARLDLGYTTNPKDWFAIFKKGSAFTANNVFQWTHLDKLVNYRNDLPWDILPKLVKQQDYTLVLFKNDTYEVVMQKDFTIQ